MDNARATILIIDNDPDLVAVLRARILSEGYNCLGASSGAQGLALYESHHPDLVITDLNMPAGDGVDLIRRLRSRSDTPIIVITGFRDAFDRELSRFEQIVTLRKPFETRALVSLIRDTLGPNRSSSTPEHLEDAA